jgi:hypothetical protein
MVSTVKQPVAAAASLTVTGLSSLAAATYVTSATYNNTTNAPLDVFAELSATPTGTPTGNMQLVLFAQASLDGTTWQTGPGSGTTTTDESDLTFIGTLPLRSVSTAQLKTFSTALAFGGVLPPYHRYVVKNDCGVTLSAGAMRTAEVSATVG